MNFKASSLIRSESTDAPNCEFIADNISININWAPAIDLNTYVAGGHTAERAELTDISFFKVADLASPILFQTCAKGRTLPRAKFEFMRADGGGTPINPPRTKIMSREIWPRENPIGGG